MRRPALMRSPVEISPRPGLILVNPGKQELHERHTVHDGV